jgi:hypothetical protein
MNENKIFSKSSIKRAPLLERSLTFNANQQLLTEKYNFNPAKVKLTFLKYSSSQPKTAKSNQQKPIRLVEKCVYCIENEYKKEIKEAFNKFGNKNSLSFTNRCTCRMYENIATKSDKFLNNQKLNTTVSQSNNSIYNHESRFDYYYKNITTSLNTKLSRSSTNDSFGKNVEIEETEEDNTGYSSNILVKSNGSFSNLNPKTNGSKCLKEKQVVLNLTKKIPVDIHLADLERIKEKYTNYLLNKEKSKTQIEKKKSLLTKQKTMYQQKYYLNSKSISSAINRVNTESNNNSYLKFTLLDSGCIKESKQEKFESPSMIDVLKSADSLKFPPADVEFKTEENFKSESENDIETIAVKEVFENNSRLLMNDIIVDVIDEEPSFNNENENEIKKNSAENGKKNLSICIKVMFFKSGREFYYF